MQCYHCAVHWLRTDDPATMAERCFRLQVTILSGGRKKKLMGRSSGITSTIAKWKPFLEGGNKELSVWAVPFGQREILSAATAPPSCLLGWLRQRGRVGRVPRHSHIPQLHWQLLPLAFPIYMKRTRRNKTVVIKKIKIFGVHMWTMNLWLHNVSSGLLQPFCKNNFIVDHHQVINWHGVMQICLSEYIHQVREIY